jgi:pimeloyl-ACP methyl ester carboxylesterase
MEMLKECGLTVPDDVEEAGLWMLEKLASPEWLETREQLKKKLSFSPLGKSKRAAGQWRKVLAETTAKDDVLLDAGLTKDVLARIEHPTMGLYGEFSPAIRSFEGLQEILPNFYGTTVRGGGHFFPMSMPKLFAGWVNGFLDKLH